MTEYTLNYIIRTPKLHKGDHYAIQQNPLLGNITYEFDGDALRSNGLNNVSFCFFVRWNEGYTAGPIDEHIWIKKELVVNEAKTVSTKDPHFDEALLASEPLETMRKRTELFERLGLSLSYTVMQKIPTSPLPADTAKLFIDIEYSDGELIKKILTYAELKEKLVEYTGRSLVMGKELKYYETELEKILSVDRSRTSAPFPGDCDMLLYGDDFSCKAIAEFKKRTSFGASVAIKDQSIMRYLAHDRLKYTRLNILRSYIEEKVGHSIPLLTVFYSTADDSDINKIKIEAVNRDISSGKSVYFALPSENSIGDNHAELLRQVLGFTE